MSYIYILSLAFVSLKLYVYFFLFKLIACICGVFRVCCKCIWFLEFSIKGAPPEHNHDELIVNTSLLILVIFMSKMWQSQL